MSYFDGDKFLDGPGFAAWLTPRLRPGMIHHNSTLGRRLTEWRRGHRAAFWAVDKTLVELEIHPSEIPDELWLGSTQVVRTLTPLTEQRSPVGQEDG